MSYEYQSETLAEGAKIGKNTVAMKSFEMGLLNYEPLLVCMDSLLRYAKAHHKRYESKLADDYVLGPEYLAAIKGTRGLLNGMGALAMEKDISTDTKDNAVIESLFWDCMNESGFTEEDL